MAECIEVLALGQMEDWFYYLVALPIALLFLASAIYALHWASRHGQLKEFDQGALSIFDEEEPVGQPTDFFPGRDPRATPSTDRKHRPLPDGLR